jgi:hypothetical protein
VRFPARRRRLRRIAGRPSLLWHRRLRRGVRPPSGMAARACQIVGRGNVKSPTVYVLRPALAVSSAIDLVGKSEC